MRALTPRSKLGMICLLLSIALAIPSPAQEAQEPPPTEPPSTEPAATTTTTAPLSQEQRDQGIDELGPEHKQWLQSVIGLISEQELDYFLRLREDFRRDAFMAAFWTPRDPDPSTPKNELRARWEEYRSSAGGLPYGDARFLLLLFNGPPGGWILPDGRPVARCFSRSRELEIWFYGGSERTERKFAVVLYRRATGSHYEAYLPGGTLRPIQRSGGLPTTNITLLCADELLRYTFREISRIAGYDQLLEQVLSPALPSPEWLATFSASATDLPPGAETFEVDVELRFPHRKQSRTAVQVMLGVSSAAAPGRRFDGELFHNFQVVGEVIRDGRLFEGFRYRFEGPTPEAASTIPLGFTRYLRPGPVDLRILLEDVFGRRYAQVLRKITVPSPEGLPAAPVAATASGPVSDRPTLRLYAPSGDVYVGKARFRAQATGEIDKVTFFLDDRPIFSKRKPPYSVELELGSKPKPHRVRVVGFVGDAEVATDQVWLNQGAMRFRVHLVEPRPGGIYPGSVTARVEVNTPDDNPPERLELFLDDDRVATLTEPPYVLSLRLSGEVAVVRAVAYLADGTSTEDAVVVNSSPFAEIVEVRLVEIYALVTGGDGRPIRGLEGDRFRVFEDGVEQRIRRFEPTADAPIRAALLIDRSSSMEPYLDRVVEAALAFAGAALASPEDRVAVLSFADRISVDAAFSGSAGQVERALAGLDALGGTALYDSLVQALNTFEGSRGPSALLLFTDGQDESSQLNFEHVLEAARQAEVTLYAIGLEAAFADKAARRLIEKLAKETGGRAHFIAGLDELGRVYGSILEELRSRYLLVYQPASARPDSELRSIRVEIDERGAKVRARRGYYP